MSLQLSAACLHGRKPSGLFVALAVSLSWLSATPAPAQESEEKVRGGVISDKGSGLASDPERARAMGLVLDFDEPPKPTITVRPHYPDGAGEEGIEGTVVVEAIIDARGHVASTRVLQSIPELDVAAVACVRRWKFKAAIKAGRPVATLAHFPVTFQDARKRSPLSGNVSAERSSSSTLAPSRATPQVARGLGPLTFDPAGADFTAWVNQFKDEVYHNWTVPKLVEFGEAGHADFEFAVMRDGSISDLRVLLSSGMVPFDRAAQSALLKSKFLPLPSDFSSPRVVMRTRFSSNEKPTPPGDHP